MPSVVHRSSTSKSDWVLPRSAHDARCLHVYRFLPSFLLKSTLRLAPCIAPGQSNINPPPSSGHIQAPIRFSETRKSVENFYVLGVKCLRRSDHRCQYLRTSARPFIPSVCQSAFFLVGPSGDSIPPVSVPVPLRPCHKNCQFGERQLSHLPLLPWFSITYRLL
jgi:hypothetical protein